MGKQKSKPRAQRKFAQGAFVPPQNLPPTPSLSTLASPCRRALHIPVIYNSSNVKDMLTLISLGTASQDNVTTRCVKLEAHLHFNMVPVVELEHNHELEEQVARGVKKVKIKKKCRENCFITKTRKKYDLRSRPTRSKRSEDCCSVSDSGDDVPLSSIARNSNVTAHTIADDPSPSVSNDTSIWSSQVQYDPVPAESCSPSKPSCIIKLRRQTKTAKKKVVAKKLKAKRRYNKAGRKKKLAPKPTLPSDPIAPVQQTAEITTEQTDPEIPVTTASVSGNTVGNTLPQKLPEGLVTSTKYRKQASRKKKLAPKPTFPSDPIAPVQQTAEITTEQTDPEIPVTTASVSGNTVGNTLPSKLTEGLETFTKYRKQTSQKKKLAPKLTLASDPIVVVQQTAETTTETTDPEIPVTTTSVNCSIIGDSIPLKSPDGLVTRTKFNKINCPSHLMSGLQELLSVPPGTYNYCKVCKRCELLSKYEKVFDMLPVSDDNEPDILEVTPRDVYDFVSEEEALKHLRRGRDLVQDVLTTKRLAIWLSNLEMNLKKTMFQDANKLGTLQRNIFLDTDVTVNKIITRIDYLNQCLKEDKKELDAMKPKRRKSKSMKKVVSARSKRVSPMSILRISPTLIPEFKTINRNEKTLIEVDNNPAIFARSKSPQPGPSNSFSLFNNLNTETLAPELKDFSTDDDECKSMKLIYDESDDSPTTPIEPVDTFTVELYNAIPPSDKQKDWSSKKIICTTRSSSEKTHGIYGSLVEIDPVSPKIKPASVEKKRCSRRVTTMVTSRFYCPNRDTNTPSEMEDFAIKEYPDIKNIQSMFPSAEILTYRPTLEEFEDPMKYMQKIQYAASKYGICKIIPPQGFSIPCHLDENTMFTTTNQYLGRLYQRWGPTVREMTGIQIYLAQINPRERDQFTKCPMFDGVELDLVKLYYAVLERGGIEEMLAHRESWASIAEQLSLVSVRGKADPKKLEKIYCKHVLPYESLSSGDRVSLLAMVDRVWKERYQSLSWRAVRPLHYQKRMLGECESDDEDQTLDPSCQSVRTVGKPCFDRLEECTGKGRILNFATYRRLASQLKAMRFPKNPNATTQEIEDAYWQLLSLGCDHLCVPSACIDTTVDKLGHTYNRDEPGGSHPWNLKRLGENPLNLMSILGKTLSVTEPTLCLNQVFSTNCWHKDPHLLAWMDYMHEGATKVWYAVSENDSGEFREAMEHLAPFAVQNKGIWLTSDTTMVPPATLLGNNVKLQRIEQNPGEYIVVFPGAYASSIATGTAISESVYFEEEDWVYRIHNIFDQMRNDHEPGMFSNIVLLFRMARDPRTSHNALLFLEKAINNIIISETNMRQEAVQLNFDFIEMKPLWNPGPVSWPNQEECSICREPLILSKTVRFDDPRLFVCLKHGVQLYSFAPEEERGAPPMVTIIYSEDALAEIMFSLMQRIRDEETLKEEAIDVES